MSMHLRREVELLKKQILALSALVEEALAKAVTAVERRDALLAHEVEEGDSPIDRLEVRIEEECLKVLALHQPVAGDLRFLVVVLKLTDELERIGDLAVNIADRAAALSEQPPCPVPYDLAGMASRARWMLKGSIDSLVDLSPELAREVWLADRDIDAIHRQMYDQIKAAIREDLPHLDSYVHLMSVSRFLERVADHAKSIAKDVIYMVEGEIVRHRGKELRPRDAG
ncbi:MAG: phosphate signaling complex protein PhoU [Armatimonadetes bacterium]|nr:phosphate signaling complex protein PhoU [Armatimonadota bacterium]